MDADQLLAIMVRRYGDAFAASHPGRDQEDVRTEWERVVRALDAAMIANAIEHLPSYPLSALGFHALAVMHAPPTVGPRPAPAPAPPGTHSATKAKALARLRELRDEFARGKA